jgi:integrase
MVEKDWCRTYVNAQTARIVRMFKWAASEELLPAELHRQLVTVEGLRKGKSNARETPRVKPVGVETVLATLPFLPPVIQAMVRFQLATGCRPAEVCIVRPIDIDMKNPTCWVYRPHKHKTENHDFTASFSLVQKHNKFCGPTGGARWTATVSIPRNRKPSGMPGAGRSDNHQ